MFSIMITAGIGEVVLHSGEYIKKQDVEVKSKIKFYITGDFSKRMSAIYHLKFIH